MKLSPNFSVTVYLALSSAILLASPVAGVLRDGGGRRLNTGQYKAKCTRFPACAHLTGTCCPTVEGIFLDCCEGITGVPTGLETPTSTPTTKEVSVTFPSASPTKAPTIVDASSDEPSQFPSETPSSFPSSTPSDERSSFPSNVPSKI
jgi:hypothetical protein